MDTLGSLGFDRPEYVRCSSFDVSFEGGNARLPEETLIYIPLLASLIPFNKMNPQYSKTILPTWALLILQYPINLEQAPDFIRSYNKGIRRLVHLSTITLSM